MGSERVRRYKFIWVVAALAGLIFAAVFFAHREGEALPGISVLTEAEYENLLRSRTQTGDRAYAGRLLIAGQPAPFDSETKAFYVPESMNGGERAGLAWSNRSMRAAFVPDPLLSDLPAAIRSGHAFALIISDGKRYHLENIVFTGLPALTLSTQSEKSYAFDAGVPAGELISFEPGGAGEAYGVSRSLATFKPRGNTTARFDKTPLRIGLYKANKTKNYMSLMGLREDDDWILNSLYTDSSKLRDKLSTDLWNRVAATDPVHNIQGSRMEYVEVFVDETYMGLYGLMEPIGKKSTALDPERDILYQAKSFLLRPEDFAASMNTLANFAVEIVYPHKWTGTQLWDPILNFIDAFQWNPDDYTTAEMLDIIDLNNAVDHSLFLQAAAVTDNFFHNNFYLARFDESGDYRIIKIPWDMNYSFGDRWEETPLFTLFDEEIVYSDNAMPDIKRLLERDPAGMGRLLASRWTELRQSVLSDESIFTAIDQASALITGSGALKRDARRWPDAHNSADTSQMLDFTKKRLRYLDEYYASLAAGGEEAP